MIMSFLMESCKPTIGQNKNEKQANNARWTSGELLGRQFPQEWRTNAISLYIHTYITFISPQI